MAGTIIRPELRKLDPTSKKYLIDGCNSQPDDVIMHYLQTGEITLQQMPKLSADRSASLQERYNQWLAMPDPEEIAAWEQIEAALARPGSDDDGLESKLRSFIMRYPNSSNIAEAKNGLREVTERIAREKLRPYFEQWDSICSMPEDALNAMQTKEQAMKEFISTTRSRFSDEMLQTFNDTLRELQGRVAEKTLEGIRYSIDELYDFIKRQTPNSELFRRADDYLWALVTRNLDLDEIKRFARKVPQSSHIAEANEILASIREWEQVKASGDIFAVHDYISNHRDAPQTIIGDAEDEFDRLKRVELDKMTANPSAYERRRALALINNDITSLAELIRRGLMTDESYRKALQKEEFEKYNPMDNIPYVESDALLADDITDVYLFGVPSTGKTCVLMGLLSSGIFDWNSAVAAGEYGERLNAYLDNMILPGRTPDDILYLLHGTAKDADGKKHLINVVEMAGEQFLRKIALNPEHELSLEDLDALAAESFKNNHRKIFFIILDPTEQTIETHKVIHIGQYDEEGKEIITEVPIRVSQKSVIRRMMNILRDEANANMMKKVDALHFIATKADVLEMKNASVRDAVVDYADSFRIAEELCLPKNAHINEATGFKPKLYTFSLGKFYVGGTFVYDSTDSDKLMNVIVENTLALRDPNFMEKFLDKLNTKVF